MWFSKVVYRNGVEICTMFAIVFIFSSFAAAIHWFGGSILPYAHPCILDILLLLVLLLCPSRVLLWCEHYRWIPQSDHIIQGCLNCLEKKTEKQRLTFYIYYKGCIILTSLISESPRGHSVWYIEVVSDLWSTKIIHILSSFALFLLHNKYFFQWQLQALFC